MVDCNRNAINTSCACSCVYWLHSTVIGHPIPRFKLLQVIDVQGRG